MEKDEDNADDYYDSSDQCTPEQAAKCQHICVKTIDGEPMCQCPEGYTGSSQCTDIDECSDRSVVEQSAHNSF